MEKLRTPLISIEKYGGKQVAIVRGKIVASGTDTKTVLAEAKRRYPAPRGGTFSS